MNFDSVILALIGSLFTFLVTAIGSSSVFFLKRTNKSILDSCLSFSAGIMISASFFSLLNPGIMYAIEQGKCAWLVAAIGFMLGGILLYVSDLIFDKLFSSKDNCFKKNLLLITSITIHNIPEGLAIGCAFGSILTNDKAALVGAIILTIGIGIQNFPEGSAVSLPLRSSGMSRFKSFIFGSLSAIVEPISSVTGAIMVTKVKQVLPLFLCFAAGAMIYVVTKELIPESQSNNNKRLMTMLTLLGFTIMMILDVALG